MPAGFIRKASFGQIILLHKQGGITANDHAVQYKSQLNVRKVQDDVKIYRKVV